MFLPFTCAQCLHFSKFSCWRADAPSITFPPEASSNERGQEREYQMREGRGDASFVLFKEQILVASAAYRNYRLVSCLLQKTPDVVEILWTRINGTACENDPPFSFNSRH